MFKDENIILFHANTVAQRRFLLKSPLIIHATKTTPVAHSNVCERERNGSQMHVHVLADAGCPYTPC